MVIYGNLYKVRQERRKKVQTKEPTKENFNFLSECFLILNELKEAEEVQAETVDRARDILFGLHSQYAKLERLYYENIQISFLKRKELYPQDLAKTIECIINSTYHDPLKKALLKWAYQPLQRILESQIERYHQEYENAIDYREQIKK